MDLFDNPLKRSAEANLTPEQIEQYKKEGENLYSTVDFETNKVLDENLQYDSYELAHLVSAIKSGLRPEDMTVEEKILIRKQYGRGWRRQFGFGEIVDED